MCIWVFWIWMCVRKFCALERICHFNKSLNYVCQLLGSTIRGNDDYKICICIIKWYQSFVTQSKKVFNDHIERTPNRNHMHHTAQKATQLCTNKNWKWRVRSGKWMVNMCHWSMLICHTRISSSLNTFTVCDMILTLIEDVFHLPPHVMRLWIMHT